MPNYLTTASQIQCPHGGKALLTTGNAKVRAGGAFVLLESDIHAVIGCLFTVGTKPSPCVRIEWSAGATKTTIGGKAPLLRNSIGECYSAENALQGVALVVNTQIKAASL